MAKKLKTLKTTKQSIRRMAKELGNVQSPELRATMLDFILFDPASSRLSISDRVFLFLDSLDGIASKTELIDSAFMDKFLNLCSDADINSRPRVRADMFSLLGRFIKSTYKYIPAELTDRAVGVAINLYENEFLSPSAESDPLREALPGLTEILLALDRKDREKHLRTLIDSLLTGFLNYNWEDMESFAWGDESLRILVNQLFALVEEGGDKTDWDKLFNVLIETENPALLSAGFYSHTWAFSNKQTWQLIKASISFEKEKGDIYAGSLYPASFFMAFFYCPKLKGECLETLVESAWRSNSVRGLFNTGFGLLRGLIQAIKDIPSKRDSFIPEYLRYLRRILDEAADIMKSAGYRLSPEWEQMQRGRSGQIPMPAWVSLHLAKDFKELIECIAVKIRQGHEREELKPLACESSLFMDAMFNCLVSFLGSGNRGSEKEKGAYVQEAFADTGFLADFLGVFFGADKLLEILSKEDTQKLSFYGEPGREKFLKAVAACGSPNAQGNLVNYVVDLTQKRRATELSVKRDRENIEKIIAALVASDAHIKLWSRLREEALTLFAPLLARELSKKSGTEIDSTGLSSIERTLEGLFAEGLGLKKVALLLFSGELTGDAFKNLKRDRSKNLGPIIERFLDMLGQSFVNEEGEKTGLLLDSWFSEETFLRECIRITDRPRKFSLRGLSGVKFLDFVAGFLEKNAGDAQALKLANNFLSLCGKGVIKNIEKEIKELPVPWAKAHQEALGRLKGALLEGFRDEAKEQGFDAVMF